MLLAEAWTGSAKDSTKGRAEIARKHECCNWESILRRSHAAPCRTRCCMAIRPRSSGSSRVKRSAACTCSLLGPSSCTFTGSPSSHLQQGLKIAAHATSHMRFVTACPNMPLNASCVPFQLYIHLSATSRAQPSSGDSSSVDGHDELATVTTQLCDAALLCAHGGHTQLRSQSSINRQERYDDAAALAAWQTALVSHQHGFPHFRQGLHVKGWVAQQNRCRTAAAPQCS